MKAFIELHGSSTGEPWLVAVNDINAVMRVACLPPTHPEHGKNVTRAIVNTFSGNHFVARESYDDVKRMIEASQK